MVADIREEDGKNVAAEINSSGGDAIFVSLDVTNEDSWKACIDQAVARFGKLDILVNNAGISSSSFEDDMGVDGFDRLIEVNTRGVFLGIKYALDKMIAAGGRLHCEHILDLGPHWLRRWPSGLQRLQGRRAASQQGDRCEVRSPGHT